MHRHKDFRYGLRLLLASILSLVMVGVMIPTASANAAEVSSTSGCIVSDDIVVDDELQSNLDKITLVMPYFRFTDGGRRLDITLSREELQNQFGFTDAQYEFLSQHVLNPPAAAYVVEDRPMQREGVSTMRRAVAGCSGVYMSYMDLTAGFAAALFAASQVSPAALAAAFTAMSSAFGPISAVVAGGIGVLGYAFFRDFAVKIIGAVAQRKGVCLTGQWSWPPLRAEIR